MFSKKKKACVPCSNKAETDFQKGNVTQNSFYLNWRKMKDNAKGAI